jgi:hypothetical protein
VEHERVRMRMQSRLMSLFLVLVCGATVTGCADMKLRRFPLSRPPNAKSRSNESGILVRRTLRLVFVAYLCEV